MSIKVFIINGKHVEIGKKIGQLMYAISATCIDPINRDGNTFKREYMLRDDGKYNVMNSVRYSGCSIYSRISETGGKWCERYHYKAALTVLCIGKYSEHRLLAGYDPWRIIARTVYFAWYVPPLTNSA